MPWGLLLVLAFFLLGSAGVLDNLGHSPDTVYDEAVYTQASVNVATEIRPSPAGGAVISRRCSAIRTSTSAISRWTPWSAGSAG